MPTETILLTNSAITGLTSDSEMLAMTSALPTEVRLGRKKPEVLPRVPQLQDFFALEAMTAPPPTSINRRSKAAKSLARMYKNDQMGCCVISGKAHNLGLWSANDSDAGGEVQATDAEIVQQYQYICGPGDNGCYINRVLTEMRDVGFIAGGKRYKIDGYVVANNTNKLMVQTVQYLFGASSIGINLPQAWTQNAVWDVTNSPIIGGHDVSPIDYDETGVYVSSWGRIYRMTWAAFLSTKYIEEYYAMLAPLWYNADGIAGSGINVAGLKAALVKVGSGVLPDVDPVTPPPVPPIPPTPVPPAVTALAISLNGTATLPYFGTVPIVLTGKGTPVTAEPGPMQAGLFVIIQDLLTLWQHVQSGAGITVLIADIQKLLSDLDVFKAQAGITVSWFVLLSDVMAIWRNVQTGASPAVLWASVQKLLNDLGISFQVVDEVPG